MTADRERALQTAQRQMMRKMVGTGRKRVLVQEVFDGLQNDGSSVSSAEIVSQATPADFELEEYVVWVQRLTDTANREFKKLGIDDWLHDQRRRKWRWAGHTARRTDGRWSHLLLEWSPVVGNRRVGHPDQRWEDCIDHVMQNCYGMCKGDWVLLAQDRSTWNQYEPSYVQ
ncbi:unnamed protein product [Polarella glacialis]|uniref:Uncharacterized protein n=1 Tax=Polarella glacialis TaxID=89957 RepID=A0A813DK44_POLGL|nr:unnamed protein product [Polarella glacialis]